MSRSRQFFPRLTLLDNALFASDIRLMGLQIKICGITEIEHARVAVEAGADALGFMFYEKSVRNIDPHKAREIIRSLPDSTRKVGVFVNATACTVWEIVELAGLTMLQFHGDETPEYCAGFNLPVIKAFRLKDEHSLENLRNYPAQLWLLDSHAAGAFGGTGARFDWELARKARGLNAPFFLAGGLTPENVAQAVKKVRPFGVDVSSGVESSPGKKDSEKIRRFIRAAREAEHD